MELLERKKENQRLLEEENARIRGKAQKEAVSGGKVTRAQIQEMLENEQQQQPDNKTEGNIWVRGAEPLVFVEIKSFSSIQRKVTWRLLWRKILTESSLKKELWRPEQ